ncbi:uncharacterized protein CcaverHIS019_0306160 [Cutaneotrichosporon cavernicola]|uniref:ATP-dependent RNA helicase n=1 Tax=Cutaneotrichosporon cavernicola TaxID=279322 RepID=A0AA48L0Z1_9TREE|nr:uncharacterized protein CcaverHIS019_0306160 [Cutaneotrichosporon cavernicola]BEI90546.1 hypothetical protein CcaverHIS019_0306160 [Cutaneotrichosporon cavernicola]
MDLKRKHVVFEPSPAGPSVHPDRAAVVDAAVKAKKPKVVSARQKRYNAARQRRQRKIKVANKAAAPKVGAWEGEVDSEVEAERDDVAPNAAVDERAIRQAEKAAKRDERRGERKARRAAERASKAVAKRSEGADEADETTGEGADEADETTAEGDETQVDGILSDGDVESDVESLNIPDLPARLSPPPLEPFPLPRLAPAPAADVLSRQGLPTGLADASFIDQSLRMALGDVALSERITKRLTELGVEDFFAVQAAILPHLLSLPLVPRPYTRLNDFLISAPTGSGKTLAYAVPIVQVLSKRVTPRLRALVVLPTRDLVVQVRETLETLAKGTGLLIGSVTGQHSFAHEQSQLVSLGDTLGGNSKLDILVATPGRLMDHLASTPNFTLQHLRFLVIDEADRLLNQSFQNWLAQVLAHTRPPTTPATGARDAHDAVAASWAVPLGLASDAFEGSEPPTSTCQKLLFSATLTRDPAKVAALDLSNPRYFIVQSPTHPLSAAALGSSFALPAELGEKVLILPPALKPLNLIHLIHDFNATPALVFTKSVEAATRLVKLLEFFEDAYVGGSKVSVRAYTRDMAPAERRRLLKDFADGNVDVVVCSDLVARGMDLPTVEHVVSYDVPLDMTKYVHRAGRTARAGRAGTAWTLVEKQEALHFKAMLKAAGHEPQVKKVKVKEDELAGYRESYDIAMARLRDEYGRE